MTLDQLIEQLEECRALWGGETPVVMADGMPVFVALTHCRDEDEDAEPTWLDIPGFGQTGLPVVVITDEATDAVTE